MKNKRAICIMRILSLLPAALVMACASRLPAQVPIHWNLDGTVDYAPAWNLWLLAALSPALALLFQFLPRIDPRRANYEKFQGRYDTFSMALPLLLLVLTAITLSETFYPGRINVGRATGLLIGVLFLFIGNMMGKLKSNYFIGCRTPWALADPDVWNKTQRMGGYVFFITGLAAVLLSLFAPEKVFFWVFLALLLGGIVLTAFMSWKWYQDKQREN